VVFTEYGGELGLKGWVFEDVPSLEMEVVRAIFGDAECKAVIVVAPIAVLDSAKLTLTTDGIFIKQTIDNACGAIAMLHVLCNMEDVQNKIVEKLKLQNDAAERGAYLEGSQELANLHAKYAAMGATELPEMSAETDLHFIAIVKTAANGGLWFDGRKDCPMALGNSNGSFLESALTTIKDLKMSEDTSMAILALLSDRDERQI
jgi:hypothetical protein